jgi:hypothetical protein
VGRAAKCLFRRAVWTVARSACSDDLKIPLAAAAGPLTSDHSSSSKRPCFLPRSAPSERSEEVIGERPSERFLDCFRMRRARPVETRRTGEKTSRSCSPRSCKTRREATNQSSPAFRSRPGGRAHDAGRPNATARQFAWRRKSSRASCCHSRSSRRPEAQRQRWSRGSGSSFGTRNSIAFGSIVSSILPAGLGFSPSRGQILSSM